MIKDIFQNLKTSSTLRINEISKDLENQGKKFLNLVLVNLHFQFQRMLKLA